MSLLEDASLLSFYFISQSSQKIPSQKGIEIEGQQTTMSNPQKQTQTALGREFIPDNTDFSLKGENNPKDQKKYLY